MTKLLTVLLLVVSTPILTTSLSASGADFRTVKQIYVPAQSAMRYRAFAAVNVPGARSCPGGCSLPESNSLLTPQPTAVILTNPPRANKVTRKKGPPQLRVSAKRRFEKSKPALHHKQASAPKNPSYPKHTAKSNSKKEPKQVDQANDVSALRNQARSLMAASQMEQADQLLERALRKYPKNRELQKDFVDSSIFQARQHLACCQNECAARRLRDALYVDPDNTTANTLLDQAFTKAGLDPGNAATHSSMAGCMLSHGRDLGAIVEYRKALALRPDAANYLKLSKLYTKYRQYNEAYPALQAAAALAPYDFDVQSELGFVSQAVNDQSGAAEAFTRALEIKPEHPVMAEALIQLRQGQLGKTKSLSDTMSLARAYVLSGEDDRAAKMLKTESGRFPGLEEKIPEIMSTEVERKKLSADLTSSKAASAASKSTMQDFLLYGPTPVKHSASAVHSNGLARPAATGCSGCGSARLSSTGR